MVAVPRFYKTLRSPLHDGRLVEGDLVFPTHPEFSKRMRVDVGDRFQEQVKVGGTQKVDGFFAAFRKVAGRRPFNTVGSDDSKGDRMEEVMRFHVLFQFKHWFGGQDMFAVVGHLRKSQRDTGSVRWSNISAFKPPFVPPVQREEQVVRTLD